MIKGVKRKKESKWKRLSVFLMLLLIFGFLLNSVGNVYQKKKEAGKILVRMEEDKSKLEEREKYLKESLARLKTEEGIKFEIRKKLNVAEAGEGVAIIVERDESASSSAAKMSFWQKFKSFFIRIFK